MRKTKTIKMSREDRKLLVDAKKTCRQALTNMTLYKDAVAAVEMVKPQTKDTENLIKRLGNQFLKNAKIRDKCFSIRWNYQRRCEVI